MIHIKKINEIVNGELFGKDDLYIKGPCSIVNSKEGFLTYIKDVKYLDCIDTTLASAIIVDKNGKTISEESKEIVECDDGVKHFLQDAGIAKNCKYYNLTGMEGLTPVEYRSLACEKLDGGYEFIPNYTGID